MAQIADWFAGESNTNFQRDVEIALLVYQNFRFDKFSRQIWNSCIQGLNHELTFKLENFSKHSTGPIKVTMSRIDDFLYVACSFIDSSTGKSAYITMQIESMGGNIAHMNYNTVFMSEHIILPDGHVIAVQDLKDSSFQYSTVSSVVDMILDHYTNVRMAFRL